MADSHKLAYSGDLLISNFQESLQHFYASVIDFSYNICYNIITITVATTIVVAQHLEET